MKTRVVPRPEFPSWCKAKLRQGYVLHFATRVLENPFKSALVSQLAGAVTVDLAEGRDTRGRSRLLEHPHRPSLLRRRWGEFVTVDARVECASVADAEM